MPEGVDLGAGRRSGEPGCPTLGGAGWAGWKGLPHRDNAESALECRPLTCAQGETATNRWVSTGGAKGYMGHVWTG
jgi:hypothetical protein